MKFLYLFLFWLFGVSSIQFNLQQMFLQITWKSLGNEEQELVDLGRGLILHFHFQEAWVAGHVPSSEVGERI